MKIPDYVAVAKGMLQEEWMVRTTLLVKERIFRHCTTLPPKEDLDAVEGKIREALRPYLTKAHKLALERWKKESQEALVAAVTEIAKDGG